MEGSFYETDQALSEYLLFHYGSAEQILPYAFGPVEALDFPVRCVMECLVPKRLTAKARALDLGCAVGRSSFELGRFCAEVVGIDHSRRFIEAANRLKRDGFLPFRYVEEGRITHPAVAAVPEGIERPRVFFEHGDAQNLRADLGEFEVVLMANLIDRLSDPLRCLRRLPGLVRTGGQLIITSPYTWLAQYTAPENWLGGYERAGQLVRTFETLQQTLESAFELSFRKNLPFLIREHARKFQWSVAEASVWIRV